MNCIAIKKNGEKCINKNKEGSEYCGVHKKLNGIKINDNVNLCSAGRIIGDLSLFNTNDPILWEECYQKIIDPKYKKGVRNFSKVIYGKKWSNKNEMPPIYLIPRIRGESYKNILLHGVSSEEVYYAPISKGYSMGDISSFTLGPIVGEGLCLVNSAFSKCICIMHIEGGGKFNPKRKNYWQPSKKPEREICILDDYFMLVDGIQVKIIEWLKENEKLWLSEWLLWNKSIALSSIGDFHWTDASPTLSYRYKDNYLTFIQWKKLCYILPSYELLKQTEVFKYLYNIWTIERRPLGLVHPKSPEDKVYPITREYIEDIFNSRDMMCCQPYVVVGLLLGVDVKI